MEELRLIFQCLSFKAVDSKSITIIVLSIDFVTERRITQYTDGSNYRKDIRQSDKFPSKSKFS